MASSTLTGGTTLTIGIRPPHGLFEGGASSLRAGIAGIEASGIDRVCVGDHVSFHGGRGFDGLVQATALAALSDLEVQTAVYLLPLRHPGTPSSTVAVHNTFVSPKLIRHEPSAYGVTPRSMVTGRI